MFKYILYFSLLSPFLGLTQQQIKGVFSPPNSFKAIMLYHLSEGDANYVNYGTVNTKGEMQIVLDATVPKGLYRLVYALPQSEHNFEFIYTGTEDIVFNFDKNTGVEFIISKENQLLQSYSQQVILAQNKLVQLYTQPIIDTLTYRRYAQKIDSLQNSYEQLSNGTVASHFISASKPYAPSKIETATEYISNVKTHYFDAIDFNDPILQNSNFITDKLLEYILQIHFSKPPYLQDYQSNIDAVYQVLAFIKPSDKLKILNITREALISSGHNALSAYLTKTYLLPLAIQLNNTELIPTLEAFMRIALG